MCIAIILATFRTEQQMIRCETEEAYVERVTALRENENVTAYRVFRSDAKFVRATVWEQQA